MEQIQFDDNFQGVGFDPTAQVDYIPTLDRKNQRLNEADEAALTHQTPVSYTHLTLPTKRIV